MSDQRHPRPIVVAAIDGTVDSDHALRYAVGEAHRRAAGLRLVHVQPQTVLMAPMLPAVPAATLHEVAAAVVKDAEEAAHAYGWTGPGLEVVIADGPRTPAILDHARDAACIVVGRRHSAAGHLFTGSTSSSLAAHADIPVLCVPSGDGEERATRVVVGVDSYETLDELLVAGFDEARSRGIPLEVMHAWRPALVYDAAIGGRVLEHDWADTVRDGLTRRIHRIHSHPDVEWCVTAHYEAPATALHEASEKAALLVLGRHGHEGWSARHLGATVRALLRAAECPVLIVPVARHDAP